MLCNVQYIWEKCDLTPIHMLDEFMILVRCMRQDVAWLAFKVFADGIQSGKLDGFRLLILKDRKVWHGDADGVGQVFKLFFSPSQHHIQIDYYRHTILSSPVLLSWPGPIPLSSTPDK